MQGTLYAVETPIKRGCKPMAYDPRVDPRAPASAPPAENGWTGYAAIKYTAIVIVVLAVIAFLVWALTHFFS
jgi:hypothetical protein